MHTTASDGLFTPSDLVKLASERCLSIIAITDHDTVDGILPALEASNVYGVGVIPGVEINTDVPGEEVHILGYFVNYKSTQLLKSLYELQHSREIRARQMVEKLGNLGLNIEWERVKQIAGESSIGRPHIAHALSEAGYVNSFDEAFEKYIGRNGPAYVEHKKMTPSQVIELILSNGGVPVLAHPDNISNLENLLGLLVKSGLKGLEVYYDSYSESSIQRLIQLAKKYDLITTGGTDYHGFKDKQETMIGTIGPDESTIGKLIDLASDENVKMLDGFCLHLLKS